MYEIVLEDKNGNQKSILLKKTLCNRKLPKLYTIPSKMGVQSGKQENYFR